MMRSITGRRQPGRGEGGTGSGARPAVLDIITLPPLGSSSSPEGVISGPRYLYPRPLLPAPRRTLAQEVEVQRSAARTTIGTNG